MEKSKTFHRRKIVTFFFLCLVLFCGLTARVVYLMVFRSQHYTAPDLYIGDLGNRQSIAYALRSPFSSRKATYAGILSPGDSGSNKSLL